MCTGEGFSLNLAFRKKIVFIGDRFSLISGFTKNLCSPENPLFSKTGKYVSEEAAKANEKVLKYLYLENNETY